jgi:hypothetical protein
MMRYERLDAASLEGAVAVKSSFSRNCAGGDRIGALRIAARFFDRSVDTRTFKRGMDAYNNPDLYRQLEKDPEQLMAAAFESLAKKFSL